MEIIKNNKKTNSKASRNNKYGQKSMKEPQSSLSLTKPNQRNRLTRSFEFFSEIFFC